MTRGREGGRESMRARQGLVPYVAGSDSDEQVEDQVQVEDAVGAPTPTAEAAAWKNIFQRKTPAKSATKATATSAAGSNSSGLGSADSNEALPATMGTQPALAPISRQRACASEKRSHQVDEVASSSEDSQQAPQQKRTKTSSKGKKAVQSHAHKRLSAKTPLDRCSEYKEQPFSVRRGHLYCRACSCSLTTKASTLKDHVESKKHKQACIRLKEGAMLDERYGNILKEMNKATADHSTIVYRCRVLRIWLRRGFAVNTLVEPELKQLVQEDRYELVKNMQLYVPVIVRELKDGLLQTLKGQNISLIFDGTTSEGEALALVCRFVDPGMTIFHFLVQFKIVASSVNADRLLYVIFDCLQEYNIGRNQLLGCSFDRAAVNLSAFRQLSAVYRSTLAVPCFSHSLDNVGKRLQQASPLAKEFMELWRSCMKSRKLRLAFVDQISQSANPDANAVACEFQEQLFGKKDSDDMGEDELEPDLETREGATYARGAATFSLKGFSATRWWSWFECLVEVTLLW